MVTSGNTGHDRCPSQLSRAHSAPKYHLTGGDKKISKGRFGFKGGQKIFAPVRQPADGSIQLQLGRRPGGSPVVGRALFTTDLRPQLQEINEYISLSPQLVGDHWRPAFYCGYDGDVDPATLQGFRVAGRWCARSPYLDAIPACRLPRHGDSSQRGDETIRLTPIPNSRAGFRSVLNNRWASSTFVAQRSSQRATRKSTRAANRS